MQKQGVKCRTPETSSILIPSRFFVTACHNGLCKRTVRITIKRDTCAESNTNTPLYCLYTNDYLRKTCQFFFAQEIEMETALCHIAA